MRVTIAERAIVAPIETTEQILSCILLACEYKFNEKENFSMEGGNEASTHGNHVNEFCFVRYRLSSTSESVHQ